MAAVNYLWDPVEQNIVREIDDDGNVIAQYTTEPFLHGNVLSQRRNGEDSYYHFDGQGSTVALTNAAGDVTDTYEYNAFGEVTERTGSTVNPFQFIGQKQYYRDEETGDYDVRQRTLRSSFGIWLSQEPVQLHLMLGEYLYAFNNPTNYLDPSGRVPEGYLDREKCEAAMKERTKWLESLKSLLDKNQIKFGRKRGSSAESVGENWHIGGATVGFFRHSSGVPWWF